MLERTFTLYKNAFQGLSKEIWLFTIVMFINRVGAMVLPFVTIYMTENLGFTLSQTGWVMASYGLGSSAGTYVGGRMTDRYGAWLTQVFSLVMAGLGFFCLIFIHSFIGFCIAYFFVIFFADILRPASMAAVGTYSKPENQTRAMSLIRLAINLGYGAGAGLGGLIAFYIGYHGLFLVDGITCLLAAAFVIFMIPRKDIEQQEAAKKQENINNQSPYRDGNFLIFIAFLFFTAFMFLQLLCTIPVYLKSEFLLNEAQLGLVNMGNCFIIALFEMPIIYELENRKQSKLKMCALGVGMIVLSFWVFLIPGQSVLIIIAFVLLITFGELISFPFTSSFVLDQSNAINRGAYMALYSLVWSIAWIISPKVGFEIADIFGWDVLWLGIGFCGTVAVIGYLLLEKRMKNKALALAVAER